MSQPRKYTCDQLGVCQHILCVCCDEATAQRVAIDRAQAEQMAPLNITEELAFWVVIMASTGAVVGLVLAVAGYLTGSLPA